MTSTYTWAAAAAVVLFAHLAAAQTPAPSLAEARKALVAAEDAATKMNTSLSCVIVDARGDLVAAQRMDRARFFTTNVALGKARASASFGQPSAALSKLAALNIGAAIEGPPMLFLQGAVPIVKNNQPLGAIGCSGGSGQQDEDAAKAGVAAIQ